MGGVDIYTVKELMGHKDIKMTMRYAHLAPVKLQSGVDILDQSVTGRQEVWQRFWRSPLSRFERPETWV